MHHNNVQLYYSAVVSRRALSCGCIGIVLKHSPTHAAIRGRYAEMASPAAPTHPRGLICASMVAALLLAAPSDARIPAFLQFHVPSTITTTTTTIVTTATTLHHASDAHDLEKSAGSALADTSDLLTDAVDISSIDHAIGHVSEVHSSILASLERPLPEELDRDPLEDLSALVEAVSSDDDLQQDTMDDFFALQDSVPFDLNSADIAFTGDDDMGEEEPDTTTFLSLEDEQMLKVYAALVSPTSLEIRINANYFTKLI